MQAKAAANPVRTKESIASYLPYWLHRIVILFTGLLIFFPQANPGRVSLKISEYASLFTTATSRATITNSMGRILREEWIRQSDITLLMIGSAIVLIGILLSAVGGCMSLGNVRMRKRGCLFPMGGGLVMLAGCGVIYRAYQNVLAHGTEVDRLGRIDPNLPVGLPLFAVLGALITVTGLIIFFMLRGRQAEEKMEMDEKFRLFLMFLPVLLLTFVFAYLPIYGWRFAFFDYKIGDALNGDNFVGFKWFTFLFENGATRADLGRVLVNTLAMSGLGIATSWLPIAFAVFLAEVPSSRFQRFVQTFTTIPNFISWVLVYAIALAIFSTDGFVNSFLRLLGNNNAAVNYLDSPDHTWLKMLLWGTWKGVGWSAIIYIAGISGIDQQLYEAADVDGANRWHRIWHITVPGLMPTYMVMLLMSIAGILSNGMEQYLVFRNARNTDVIQVLDLYVYDIGIGQGLIPLSTVVGIFKSLIGVTLLFGANRISKAIRGESII